jgi:cell division protein FtsI (penicillin-binding protein 3)
MMLARVHLVGAIVIALSGAMMVRLWYLQILEKDFLQDQGDARTIRMERINAHRGMIQDRFGKPLAVSTPVLSLWANPGEVLESKENLATLSDQLNVEPDVFKARLEKA